MNSNIQLPAWSFWVMGIGLGAFIALVALSIRRNQGMKRSLFAAPYSLWMIAFTVLPVILIGYYSFTDANGAFTLDNFRNFWDSNYAKNQLYATLGPDAAQFMVRGTVNVDTLVYSLWMAFLCTSICLVLGYPAALCDLYVSIMLGRYENASTLLLGCVDRCKIADAHSQAIAQAPLLQ